MAKLAPILEKEAYNTTIHTATRTTGTSLSNMHEQSFRSLQVPGLSLHSLHFDSNSHKHE
jgi:hypothetical protein